MTIKLWKADVSDTNLIHSMQKKAFEPLLKKYKDIDTSPATEDKEKTFIRIKQPFTDYYLIKDNNQTVGAIRIVKKAYNTYRISPVFILPEFQSKGLAKESIKLAMTLYPNAKTWMLDTIKQEEVTCKLYESLGFVPNGKEKSVNDLMTLVYYVKDL